MPDIQALLTRKDGWFTDELAKEFSGRVSRPLVNQFAPRNQRPSLRLSQMGTRCPCALWHSIHHPEQAEKLPPWVENKFSFGHLTEAWALTLARAAGHTVEGEQDELIFDGIRGHRDAVVDGCILDVKSSSSAGYNKFEDGSIASKDDFGYLEQLDGYIGACADDPLVKVKDKGYLLVIDKQLGHMILYEHAYRENHIRRRVDEYKRIVASNSPPTCTCKSIPHGASGNQCLDVKSSYNSFKYCCFPKLRTFIYADGPVYLTKVVKRPKEHIIEVDRYGNRIT